MAERGASRRRSAKSPCRTANRHSFALRFPLRRRTVSSKLGQACRQCRTPTTDFDIDYGLFDEIIWPALAERVPAFEAIKVTNAHSCHYDVNTLDENVILGHVPEVENLLVAAGFSGHGLMQSPAVGRALSELIRFGEYRTLDLSRLGYERVLAGSPLRETNCY